MKIPRGKLLFLTLGLVLASIALALVGIRPRWIDPPLHPVEIPPPDDFIYSWCICRPVLTELLWKHGDTPDEPFDDSPPLPQADDLASFLEELAKTPELTFQPRTGFQAAELWAFDVFHLDGGEDFVTNAAAMRQPLQTLFEAIEPIIDDLLDAIGDDPFVISDHVPAEILAAKSTLALVDGDVRSALTSLRRGARMGNAAIDYRLKPSNTIIQILPFYWFLRKQPEIFSEDDLVAMEEILLSMHVMFESPGDRVRSSATIIIDDIEADRQSGEYLAENFFGHHKLQIILPLFFHKDSIKRDYFHAFQHLVRIAEDWEIGKVNFTEFESFNNQLAAKHRSLWKYQNPLGLSMLLDESWLKYCPQILANLMIGRVALDMLWLASRVERYRRSRGGFPDDAAELAGFTDIPIDRFKPAERLKYLRTPGGFLIYSEYVDCVDDGGLPIAWESHIGRRDGVSDHGLEIFFSGNGNERGDLTMPFEK